MGTCKTLSKVLFSRIIIDNFLCRCNSSNISEKLPGKVPEQDEELPPGEVDRNEVCGARYLFDWLRGEVIMKVKQMNEAVLFNPVYRHMNIKKPNRRSV